MLQEVYIEGENLSYYTKNMGENDIDAIYLKGKYNLTSTLVFLFIIWMLPIKR